MNENAAWRIIWRQRLKQLLLFFGIGLPRRDLNLNWSLPPTSRRQKRPPVKNGDINRALAEYNDHLLPWLEHSKSLINQINRYHLPPQQRWSTNKHFSRLLYPRIRRIIDSYQNNGSVPDDPQRAQLVDLAIGCLQSLINGHLLTYQGFYDQPNRHYGRHRDSANLCAFRIAEWCLLSQKLSALRYRAIEPITWYAANKIFHVMAAYESIDTKYPCLKLKEAKDSYSDIKTQFTLLHTIGLFDPLSFPGSQQPLVEIYSRSLLTHLDPNIAAGSLATDEVLICHNQKHLAHRVPRWAEEHASTLNTHALQLNLQHDYQDIIDSLEQKNPFLIQSPLLKRFKDNERLSLIVTLYRTFQHQLQREFNPTPPMANAQNLSIYSGFKECYQLQRDYFNQRWDNRVLRDSLAKRSAFLGEDETAEVESLWYCLANNHKELTLQTQETRFTVPMDIGRVVIYDFYEQANQTPQLGVINRLQRTGEQRVELTIQKLASYFEPVTFTSLETDTNNEQKQAALLIRVHHDHQHEPPQWSLLCPNNLHYWQGKKLGLGRLNGAYRIQLDKLLMASQSFCIYQLKFRSSLRSINRS